MTKQHDEGKRPAGELPAASQPAVLIVDDERPIANVVAAVVEDAGYTPIVAGHGGQALELLRQQWPVLMIVDLMMPHLDGAELIAEVNAQAVERELPVPPVILMTAAGRLYAEAANADVILPKPFDLADLEMLIRRLLHGS